MQNSSVSFVKQEPGKVNVEFEKYTSEIQKLSKQLAYADSIVKEGLLAKEKLKKSVSELRIENSNLILVNRRLRSQLMSLGCKVEENERIIKSLNPIESPKEKPAFTDGLSESEGLFDRNSKFYEKKRVGNPWIIDRSQTKINQLSIEFQSYSAIVVKKKRDFSDTISKIINKKKEELSIRIPSILWVERQASFGIIPKNMKNKKRLLLVSRTINLSFTPKKALLKLKTERIFSIRSRQKSLSQPKLSTSTLSIFIPALFRCTNRVFSNRIIRQTQIHIIRPMSFTLMKFHIFSFEIGRAQLEPVLISEEEESLMLLASQHLKPVLKLSRTQNFSYSPKKKMLLMKRQAAFKILPQERSRRIYIPKNKVELVLSAGITPKITQLKVQNFKIFNDFSPPPQEFEFFNVFKVVKKLSIAKFKKISILRTEESVEDFEVSSTKSRKGKNPAKRGSAIEEYFTLVFFIQTFQAVKLNFQEKDKILMIKSADLYSKVQQIKLPFNYWHDWVKEQFNFIANRA